MSNYSCAPDAVIIGINDTGETVCAACARISTQQGNAKEILQKSTGNANNASLISKVLQSGHSSVIEHTFFNLAFSDVSVMVEQFMIEFRLASFTVKSRRYVDFSQVGYYTPEFPADMPWGTAVSETYASHMDNLFKEYEFFLSQGIPKEDARFVLPYCYRSNFYCSMNARELIHVLHAMLDGRGKNFSEIHHLGERLLQQAKQLCPSIFETFSSGREKERHMMELNDLLPSAPAAYGGYREKVELLAYPTDSAALAAKAALITHTQLPDDEINRILLDSGTKEEILNRLVHHVRPRELETLNYTFRLNGISLAGVTHVVRHRMQNICIPSLKAANRDRHVLPATIAARPELCCRYEDIFARNAALYHQLQESGVPEELLVYYTLSGNTLDLLTTMNARELLLFLRLRTCTRAQWEIRDYALELLKRLRGICPEIFRHYGASCYLEGKCPEGKLTCGHYAEMQAFFQKL